MTPPTPHIDSEKFAARAAGKQEVEVDSMQDGGLHGADQPVRQWTQAEIRRHFPRDSNRIPASRRVRGDYELNPDFGTPPRWREAAVLVPLVDHPDGLTMIFTERTAHLAAHAGQVSFPGGQIEPDDVDPEDAALRETEEEIGLSRKSIEVLGRLDIYLTRTGFRVTPVVGLVRPPFHLRPDPEEVAEVFEVPLSIILSPDNPQEVSREILGKPRRFYAFPYQGHFIWGATAGMLVNLRDLLGRTC